MMDGTNRAQTHTLEAVLSAILVAVTIVVFISSTTIPLSVDDPTIEGLNSDIETEVESLIDESKADGTFKEALLEWDDDDERMNSTESGGFALPHGGYEQFPSHDFGSKVSALEEEYEEESLSMMISLTPVYNGSAVSGGTAERQDRFVFYDPEITRGERITVTREIVLYEDYHFYQPAATLTSGATDPSVVNNEPPEDYDDGIYLGSDGHSYPIPDHGGELDSEQIYNVVEVEIVAWHLAGE